MSRRKKIALVSLLFALLSVTAVAQLDKLLKGGGIAFVISKFGPDINKALNKLTKTNNDDPKYATKVVPVLSAGTGAYAGGVQVAGPREAVDKVQVIAQIEGNVNFIGGFRIRALVPIASKSISNIRRVPGVGVSGLLST